MAFDVDKNIDLPRAGTGFNYCQDEEFGLDFVGVGQGQVIDVDAGRVSLESPETIEQSVGFRAPKPAHILAGGLVFELYNLSGQAGGRDERTVQMRGADGATDAVTVRADYILVVASRWREGQYGLATLPTDAPVVIDSESDGFRRQFGEVSEPIRMLLRAGKNGIIQLTNEASASVRVMCPGSSKRAYDLSQDTSDQEQVSAGVERAVTQAADASSDPEELFSQELQRLSEAGKLTLSIGITLAEQGWFDEVLRYLPKFVDKQGYGTIMAVLSEHGFFADAGAVIKLLRKYPEIANLDNVRKLAARQGVTYVLPGEQGGQNGRAVLETPGMDTRFV